MRTFAELTESALRHMDEKPLELGEKARSCAVSSYSDSERFQRELARVYLNACRHRGARLVRELMYFILPSTFLLYYGDHLALISLTPISVDQTSFRYIPLVPSREGLANPEILERVESLKVIISQDIAILEDVQKGLILIIAWMKFHLYREAGIPLKI